MVTSIFAGFESSHWYFEDGKPCYEIPLKTPRKDGSLMREPTVRDARTLHLVPSVTTITSVIKKPALDAWINQQYIMAALTLPKLEGENQDDFARRVVVDGRAHSRQAMDFGTKLHAMVEWWIATTYGLPVVYVPEIEPHEMAFLIGFAKWVEQNPLEPQVLELSFANLQYRYGGRIDYIGGISFTNSKGAFALPRSVIDWKTQATQPGKPIVFYPDWVPQLKAYSHGIEEPDTPVVSVVVSSTEPGRVEANYWLGADWGWPVFQAASKIWYSPLGRGATLPGGTGGEDSFDGVD